MNMLNRVIICSYVSYFFLRFVSWIRECKATFSFPTKQLIEPFEGNSTSSKLISNIGFYSTSVARVSAHSDDK
jgi:hypothetical protein